VKPSPNTARWLLAGALLALPLAARADDPLTWPFDLQTSGQDVNWLSPSAVYNAANRYGLSYEITKLEVTVKYLIFHFTLDVTDQIPPEQRTGSATIDGPLPVTLYDGDLVYPPPPGSPSFSGHLHIGLNAGGNAFITLTNVYLGTAVVDLGPPWGTVTVQLEEIHMVGTIGAQAFRYARGDLNCDGSINFNDIDPFVLALSGQAGYEAAYPDCDWLNADVNADDAVDFHDIDPFVALLSG